MLEFFFQSKNWCPLAFKMCFSSNIWNRIEQVAWEAVSSSSLVNLLATKEQPHLSGDPPGVLGPDPCVDFHAACAYCDLRRRENQPATLQVLWIIGNGKILYCKHTQLSKQSNTYLVPILHSAKIILGLGESLEGTIPNHRAQAFTSLISVKTWTEFYI